MTTKVNKAKRLKTVYKTLDRFALVSVTDAVKAVKENATAKFDETIEVAMNLTVDPRHADQIVRGMVELPNGSGKTVRVIVFAKGEKAEEAKKAGADIVGDEDLMKKIQGGFMDFDRCISTPDMMPVVGRLGQILGPRGLMPNPKLGTVTMDVAKAVKSVKGGAVEFRAEKEGIIHAGVGKASFDNKKIVENVESFIKAIVKARPSGAKGVYITSAIVSSTMGPGYRIDISEFLKEMAA